MLAPRIEKVLNFGE